MSHAKLHFYDAAEPKNIHSGVHAACAINGRYAWSAEDMARMSGIFRYSVLGEAHWAQRARGIDVENEAATPADVVPFMEERRKYLGIKEHNDNRFDGTAYVNRSNWGDVIERCVHAGIILPLWWVATLDGTTEVTETVGGITYHPWAVQYFGGDTAFDESILHGVNNFHHFSGV